MDTEDLFYKMKKNLQIFYKKFKIFKKLLNIKIKVFREPKKKLWFIRNKLKN